jgi:hypothetical protein
MAEIVDLIAKLELQVGGSDQLMKQVQAFKAQSTAIDELTRKRDLLERQSAKDKSPERAARAKVAIDQLNKSIDTQTQALTKQVQQQQLVQRAAQQELGIIQKLQDKLQDLNRARTSQTTVQGIKDINKEIATLNQELRQLSDTSGGSGGNSGGNKGLLSQLFGVGSAEGAGKQVLQGALAGAGIGVGFSVLPALTSSLVEYTSKLLDARDAEFAAKEGVHSLNQSLVQQLVEFTDLNKVITEAFGGLNTYQAEVERVSAIGVQRGEVFAQRQRQFDAEQNAREAEISQLSELQGVYNQLTNALVKYDQTKNLEGLQERIANIGLSPIELARVKATIKKTFEEINDLPRGSRDAARKALRLSENDELIKNRAQTNERLNKLIENNETQRKGFVAQTNREIYELSKKLNEDIASENDKFVQDEIGRKEKTAALIEQSYQNQGEAAVRALNIEVEAARKAGTLFGKTEGEKLTNKEKFDERFNNLVKENEAKKEEALRLFNVQQVQEQQKLNEQLLQGEITALNHRLQLLTGTDLQANIDLRNAVADKELMLQRTANANNYDEQVRANEKKQQELIAAGKTETKEYQDLLQTLSNIYDDYAKAQQNAELTNTTKRIANIRMAYADIVDVVGKETKNLQSAIARSFSGEQLDIAQGSGGFFGRDFKQRLSKLRETIVTERNNIAQNEKLLPTAQERLQKATQTADTASPETKKAAQEEKQSAEQQLNDINTLVNNSKRKEIDTERELLKEKVNAYSKAYEDIAKVAQNGYNQIAEFEQEQLDRQISAREAQLNVALELAKKGNTELLEETRNALKADRKEQRQNALEQQAINSALQLSYALLAIAKATAEGGGFGSAATVAAAVGALVTGYGLVRSFNNTTEGFKDGVIDYAGKGTETSDSNTVKISRGESVMTAKATRQFKDELKMMQMGIDPYRGLQMPTNDSDRAVTRSEFNQQQKTLTDIRDAIQGRDINVKTITTRDHIEHMVSEQQRLDKRKYGQIRK